MVKADAPVDELPVSIDDALSTPLPPDVGAAVARAYGTEERPATFGDWLDGMAAAYAATDVDPEPEDMCAVEESRHMVERGGETTAYVCVLDPLAIPFIEGRSAHVRSDPPVGEGTIEFRIGPDDVTVDPAEAVVSFGVDAPPPDAPLSVEETYDRLCPYGHAFPESGLRALGRRRRGNRDDGHRRRDGGRRRRRHRPALACDPVSTARRSGPTRRFPPSAPVGGRSCHTPRGRRRPSQVRRSSRTGRRA
jgi:hypothetical protein